MSFGEVVRIMPSGGALVMSSNTGRYFPYYGEQRLAVGDKVEFETDKADTVIHHLCKLPRT